MSSNNVQILKTRVTHPNDGNYHDCDVSFFITEKLSDKSVSILPIANDLGIACAYQMSHKQALRLAHSILEKILVSDSAKPLLERLENVINS
jgi:hypothetical protein